MCFSLTTIADRIVGRGVVNFSSLWNVFLSFFLLSFRGTEERPRKCVTGEDLQSTEFGRNRLLRPEIL